MKYLFIIITFFALSGCFDNSKTINISANPGEYKTKTIGELSKKQKVSATIKIVVFNNNDSWPPAAYVGFYQGKNRDNSIQFLIIRNKKDDRYLVAGYRIITNGKEEKVASIKNIDIGAKVKIDMSIINGVVTLSLDDNKSLEIQTRLKDVKPYIAVSSSNASFVIK